MSTPGNSFIAITGASGVVGRDLVSRFQRTHRVIALAHSNLDVPGVDVVQCDLAKPQFGLGDEQWAELAAKTDVIVHSAAVTTWGLPQEQYEPVNIRGTRHVIDFACRAKAPLHLVSSCFVLALESPRCEEIVRRDNVVLPYIRSKREAERIVRESGVPYNIYRPTNLVGHSTNGASSRPQIVQMMADWIGRGRAPYFPAHSGNVVDVAPVDFVSSAVAGAIEAGELGQELWITYGEESMTVEAALGEVIQHARRVGRSIDPALVVDPREPLPMPLEDVPAMSRAFLKVLFDVSAVTHACGGVLPSSLDVLRRYGASEISSASAFRNSLDYWFARRQSENSSVQ